MLHLRNFVDSKFYSSSFSNSVIGPIFACVCEVQLRLRANVFLSYNSRRWINLIETRLAAAIAAAVVVRTMHSHAHSIKKGI